MSKTKPEGQDIAEVEKPIAPGRVFRDTLYTSRTLVLPDGSTLAVTKAHVTAATDEQFAFLKAHPELVQE